MVWLWVLLAFALTPVLGGTFWALATEGRRNHPKWGVFRSVQYAHRGLHNRELGMRSYGACVDLLVTYFG